MFNPRWLRLLPFFAVLLAGYITYREIQGYGLGSVTQIIAHVSPILLLKTIVLTVLGYIALAAYDGLALKQLGKSLPLKQVLLVGFTSFAVSNNAGHALVSGGAIRYRFYSNWGLEGFEIAQIIALSTLTYFLANGTLLVISYYFAPIGLLDDRHLMGGALHWLMIAILLLLTVYWALVISGKSQFHWRGREIVLPTTSMSLLQLCIGIIDLLLAACVLYLLLVQYLDLPFSVFLNVYLIAQVVGLFSQSPGGIGVFEGTFIYLLSARHPVPELFAALLVYRLIYYVFPLMVACVCLLIYELKQQQHFLKKASIPLQAMQQVVPYILSLVMLIGGAMLLISGTTPAEEDRIKWLAEIFPVGFIQASHILATVTGVLLLVVARAVRLKLRSAYYVSLVLLSVGAIASLFKGIDYEEATVLLIMIAMLLPAKRHFYRPSRMDEVKLTLDWLLLIVLIAGFSIWLGFFSYQEIEYSHQLWWNFSVENNAATFLRTTLILLILLTSAFVYFFIRRRLYKPSIATQEELDIAAICARDSNDSNHFLALTGDKFFFWNENKTGYISYVTTEKYWIGIGDPCGEELIKDDLLWRFRETADEYGAKIAFYRIKPNDLTLYIDLGLTMVKLGEEAVVDLTNFSLQGKSKSSLRHAYNKIEREEYYFEMIKSKDVDIVLPVLKDISDNWLARKNTREKGISLGFFNEQYLLRCDVAVLKKNNQIVAFANIWKPENKTELSIDLMRYSDIAPNGAMEHLTISIMLWAKEQGYQKFNLGMAPLSGLENHAFAPVWNKFGSSIFKYGNEFYHFQGLRNYKEKFDPIWESRYLAVPSMLDVPSALFQVSSKIAGGVRGVFSK